MHDTPVPDATARPTSAAAVELDGAEVGLFILWSKARPLQDRILADLSERFRVLRAVEVRWSKALVMHNYRRFYSDLRVRGVYHALNKGVAPFLAVTVVDPRPVLAERETGRGPRRVLARFFDAKATYREWLGGLEVHCGETSTENRRDLAMLLGVEAWDPDGPSWDQVVAPLPRDLSGARGWESESDLFAVLGAAAPYVRIDGGLGCLELLTDAAADLVTILDAVPGSATVPSCGGRFRIRLGGRRRDVLLRDVADGSLDPGLARAALAHRVRGVDGVFVPAAEEALDVMAYARLARGGACGHAEAVRLAKLAADVGLLEWTVEALADPERSAVLVRNRWAQRGFSYATPRDPALPPTPFGAGPEAGATVGVRLAQGARVLGRRGASFYGAGRDQVLLRAPWLRSIRRRFRRRRG